MKTKDGNYFAPGKRYIVLPQERPEVSKGGIFIPETARNDVVHIQATIVERGTFKPLKPEDEYVAEVGDRIIHNIHAGLKLVIDGVVHKVLAENDIALVIKTDKT